MRVFDHGTLSTTFADGRLEAAFNAYHNARGRRLATATAVVAQVLWVTATLRVVTAAASELALSPRRALLLVVLIFASVVQGRTINILRQPEQVWRHESVKTWQVLVSLTACMVTSILARPDELNMKSPVAVNGCRAWFFLGERYRLPVLLRLHAISMVCYVMQEVDLALLLRKGRGLGTLSHNFCSLLAVQAVPLLLGIAWEARLRREFIIGRNLPVQHLGRFWQSALRHSRAQPAPVPHPRGW